MTNTTSPQALYEQLVTLSQDAFAAQLYNTSYHALAAALHCARVLPDDATLERIGALAEQQLAVIDNQDPDYEHSSAAAARRGHDNIFSLLARQSRAIVEMRRTDRKRSEWEQLTREG
jgi:hypothetical protein